MPRDQPPAALHEWELLALFQAVPLGVAVIDRGLRFVHLNERMAAMNSTTVESAIGRTIDEILPHVADILRQLISHVFETGETLRKMALTGPLATQAGPGWMHVEADYHPLRDEHGEIARMLVMVRDITDEVETRSAIERERARAAGAVRASGGLGFEWDPETDTVEWSEGLERLTGFTADEIAPGSAGWRAHVLPEDVWKISEATQHYLLTGENKPLPYRFRRKSGEIAWLSTTIERIRDARGRERVFGLVRDVTQQIQASEELRASEERFRMLADFVPDIIWTASASGYTDWLNRRWKEYSGRAVPDSPIGWRESFHPEDFERIYPLWKQAIADGQPYEGEYRLKRADGVYHWFLGRAIPLRDERGAVVKWLGTATDVHEYRVTLDRLRATEEQNALALEAGRIGAFQWQATNNVLTFSPEAQAMFGLAQCEFDSGTMQWRTAVHPEDHEKVRSLTEQAIEARQPRLQMEFRIVSSVSTAARWVESRGRIEYDEAGRPLRTSGVFVDITARKLQEERISLLLREMHHRLKNAFAMIAALAGLSAKGARDVQSYADSLRGRIQSLALAHTLSFSDTENESVGVIELIRQLLAPFILENDPRVSVSGSPRLRVVERHVSPLALTLHELATNAVKYGGLRGFDGKLSVLVQPTAEIGGAGIGIRWRETGVQDFEHAARGFGSVLIERSMQQIGARLERRIEGDVFAVDLILPQ